MKMRRIFKHLPEERANRVTPHCRLARRVAEYRVWRVKFNESVGVTCVRPLDEETCEILGFSGTLTSVGHRWPSFLSIFVRHGTSMLRAVG